jgi:hypothetical protein
MLVHDRMATEININKLYTYVYNGVISMRHPVHQLQGQGTHRSFFPEQLLHTDAFPQGSLSTEQPLHRDVFTQESLYTERSFYTRQPLHKGLSDTDPFTQRRLYIHKAAFRQKLLHKKPLH